MIGWILKAIAAVTGVGTGAKIAAVASVLAIGGSWVWWQSGKVDRLTEALRAAKSSLATCEARRLDVEEHNEVLNEIDSLDRDGLRDRAFEWLLPED